MNKQNKEGEPGKTPTKIEKKITNSNKNVVRNKNVGRFFFKNLIKM